MTSKLLSLFAATTALLTACGGGSDSVQADAAAPAASSPAPAASSPAPAASSPPPAASAPAGGAPAPMPGPTANTITSARLSTCPAAPFPPLGTTVDPAQAYACLVGSAHGHVLPGLMRPCTLTIGPDLTLSLTADGTTFQMSPPFGSHIYSKDLTSGVIYLIAEQPGGRTFAVDAGGVLAGAGNVFTGAGGALAASYSAFVGDSGKTCMFEIK